MLLQNIFDYLFRKRAIVFLGRAGMHCHYNAEKYFVDSEMLVSPPYDVVVYSDRIYLIKGEKKYSVDETIKSNVLAFLKKELEKQDIKYEISSSKAYS